MIVMMRITMKIMDSMDIMDIMDSMIITAWMAMAGAVSALVLNHAEISLAYEPTSMCLSISNAHSNEFLSQSMLAMASPNIN